MTNFFHEMRQLSSDLKIEKALMKDFNINNTEVLKAIAKKWNFITKSFILSFEIEEREKYDSLIFFYFNQSCFVKKDHNRFTIEIGDFYKTRVYALYFRQLKNFNDKYGEDLKEEIRFLTLNKKNDLKYPRGQDDVICKLWLHHHGFSTFNPWTIN